MDSSGSTATAMGKLILGQTKAVSAAWTDNTNITLLFEKTEKESELTLGHPYTEKERLTVHPI